MGTKYKIHPAIGIARVGNSAEFYLAPDTPGGLPLDPVTNQPIYDGQGTLPANLFRDAGGALKKQAARFKVYAYDDTNPEDPGTLVQIGSTANGEAVASIEWTVYLASKKASWFQFEQLTGSGMEGDAGYLKNGSANPLRSNSKLGLTTDPTTLDDPRRRQLLLDPGPRTVSGATAAPADFTVASKGLKPFDITTLGNIQTDADGNLIVLGGEGNSGSNSTTTEIKHYANNDGWFDDVSDGPVNATLVLANGSRIPIDQPSWVLCGPPAYAPEVFNLVSLYDTIYDVFIREFDLNPAIFANGKFQTSYKPNKTTDIEPILIRPNLYRNVAKISDFGATEHASVAVQGSSSFKSQSLPLVRRPDQTNVGKDLMPKLAGDNPISKVTTSEYLSVTRTQYFLFQQFAHGNVTTTPTASAGDGVALDRANLENCVGGAFCPGIEITWICRNPTLYQPLPALPALSDAFRLRHKDVSGGLSLTNGANNDYSAGLEPGDATKYMAQPWQADFNECSVQGDFGWWWPAQRPYAVFPLAMPAQQLQWTRQSDTNSKEFEDLQMVTNWKDLGIILRTDAAGKNFLEIERNQDAIDNFPPVDDGAEDAVLYVAATPLKGRDAKKV
ncbi:LodA/GoxA family CTQ-dependent oxidase [uncultured Roseibium sp.]|uniref:LodA/GoxA family CTQ-dependent oxidase n=1 Tax=uncultured Roseibium sp. TaxID=1936171 RepID=UPI00261C470B|nr:LodA/GoxA family CTQ-dependent oxidase [uncultured Roseibium sp.]